MGNFEQVARIGIQLAAGVLMGDAIANSAEFQAASAGLISIATFGWWFYKNRKAAK
jgi:hypothetical protein